MDISKSRELFEVEEIRLSYFVVSGFALSVLSSLILVAAAIGYRWDLWSVKFALVALTIYATYGAFAGAAVSLIGVGKSWPGGNSRGLVMSLLGVVIGFGSFWTIFDHWKKVQTSPFIHDITTDTNNPPPFSAVVAIRESLNANPHNYEGDKLALLQRYGGFNEPYKDLSPFIAKSPPSETFDAALKLAEEMGWKIIDVDATNGRIEASDTSFWYGFTDDIVIRVVEENGGSRVDIRSLSRVGKSDVGVNAARIRSYISALSGKIEGD